MKQDEKLQDGKMMEYQEGERAVISYAGIAD